MRSAEMVPGSGVTVVTGGLSSTVDSGGMLAMPDTWSRPTYPDATVKVWPLLTATAGRTLASSDGAEDTVESGMRSIMAPVAIPVLDR
jgi:hypothetical protein